MTTDSPTELRLNADVLRAQLAALDVEERESYDAFRGRQAEIAAKRHAIKATVAMFDDPFMRALSQASVDDVRDPLALPTPTPTSPGAQAAEGRVEGSKGVISAFVGEGYPGREPRQRETIVTILREQAEGDRTMAVSEIQKELNRRLGLNVATQSVSSQLNKLEGKGVVEHLGKRWRLRGGPDA